MVNIIRQTRSHPALFLGASPRAAVALLNSSKAFAALQGRDFVTPDDVKTLALPVLRHRVILTPEKEMEGSSPDQVLRQIVDSVEVPR
jgi:MoxR-like ATPase